MTRGKDQIRNELCEAETGTCLISAIPSGVTASALKNISETEKSHEIIYIGDPMCSWCWGMSPSLIRLRDTFNEMGIGFRVVVGGLRPGGGGNWDENRKAGLKQNWQAVIQKSGQPIGFGLLDREHFDYDTEPACRAVVAARPFTGNREMEFFEAIQKKFYVDGHDPKEAEFYRSLCNEFRIDFEKFIARFEDDDVREITFSEFDLGRSWGVQAFPAVILSHQDKRRYIAQGFSEFGKMEARIRELLK